MESTSTLTNPVKMAIRHNFVPSKVANGKPVTDAYDRHTVSFSKQVTDIDDFVHVVTASITLTVPRVTDLTRTDLNDMLAFARNFTGVVLNIDALLRNES